MKKHIRVVVADDSRLLRRMVRDILESSNYIRIVGEASNGEETLEVVRRTKPDVLLLDIVMPKKDGIAVIKEIMQENPLPIVVFSSLTRENAEITLTALEHGAFDFILKPGGTPVPLSLNDVKEELIRKIRVAAYVGPIKLTVKRMIKRENKATLMSPRHRVADTVVVIGASTGGPSIIRYLISRLPANLPAAVLVIQHMPPLFTTLFADRLNKSSALLVKEAEDGETLLTGRVYVAPGDYHMEVERRVNDIVISLNRGPKVHGVRPALDVTLKSVSETFNSKVIAVVLTGMGRDGAEGALKVKQYGGYVIAQNESSSLVYGMPKAVVEVGAADLVTDYRLIPKAITKAIETKRGLMNGYA